MQQPFGLGIVKHSFSDAIFDAAGRIEIFQFGYYSSLQIIGCFIIFQFQQGGAADQIGYFFINFHRGISFQGVILIIRRGYPVFLAGYSALITVTKAISGDIVS